MIKKGLVLDCNNCRDLSATDHVATVLAGLRYNHACPLYTLPVGLDRYGATPAGSIEVASRILDLRKAFAFALRELLFRYRLECSAHGMEQKQKLLECLILPSAVAHHIIAWLDAHEHTLFSLSIDFKDFALIKSLYSGPWLNLTSQTAICCHEAVTGKAAGYRPVILLVLMIMCT